MDSKKLARVFKSYGKEKLFCSREDGFTYVTDGALMVRVPANYETILRDTFSHFPEFFTQTGCLDHGKLREGPQSLGKVASWDAPREVTNTGLTYTIKKGTLSILATDSEYIFINSDYLTPFEGCTLKAKDSRSPIVVHQGEDAVAVILPILVKNPPEWLRPLSGKNCKSA